MAKITLSRSLLLRLLVFLCFALLVSCQIPAGRHGGRGRGRGNARNLDIPAPGEKVVSVLDFEAKNDGGKKDNALPFIRAWKAACNYMGKARLVIPEGVFKLSETIFAGPCNNTSPIIVQIKGTLKASRNPSDFSEATWITFERINGLIVLGSGGLIDGQGDSMWKFNDCGKNPGGCVLPPCNLKFNHVNNAIVRRIHSINPKGFNIHIFGSQNFRLQRIHLTAPGDSPNTDGIHISNSTHVRVTRSIIGTGDDCISLGQGSVGVGIIGVTCGPGHGISIGSLGKDRAELPVIDINVRNVTFVRTDNGVRIKTWAKNNPGSVTGVTFEDIIMDTVRNPIIIDQQYGSKSSSQASQIKIDTVHYRNIRGTTTSPVAVNFICSKAFPCKNLELANINLKHATPTMTLTSVCQNANILSKIGILNPPACK